MSAVSEPLWRPPPADWRLSNAGVHLWRASVDRPAWRVRQLAQTLSGDERARAERFYFERDKNHFVVGRGLLRRSSVATWASNHADWHFGVAPMASRCWWNQLGRTLCFNRSRSQGLVLYASTRDREVGIDLERIRSMPEAKWIAHHFFSARETTAFYALPPGRRLEAFFNCWTRKEAYIKALGDALARPLDRFDVFLAPREPARLLHVEGDPQEVARWCLVALMPAASYVAALAVEGDGWQLACWEWADECIDEARPALTGEPEEP
jgi:4'-phosphopantetheinyl transferase